MAVSGVSFSMSSAYSSEPPAKRVAVESSEVISGSCNYATFDVGALRSDSSLDWLLLDSSQSFAEEQTSLQGAFQGPVEERVSQVASTYLASLVIDPMEAPIESFVTDAFLDAILGGPLLSPEDLALLASVPNPIDKEMGPKVKHVRVETPLEETFKQAQTVPFQEENPFLEQCENPFLEQSEET